MMTSDQSSFESPRRGAIRYVEAFRARWKLIAGLVVVAVGAAAIAVSVLPDRYDANADISITPVSVADETLRGLSIFREGSGASSAIITAARVFNSPATFRRAFDKLEGAAADADIQITPLSQADIVTISASARTAQGAAEAANAFADAAVAIRNELFARQVDARIGQLREEIALFPQAQRQGNFEFATLQQQLGALVALRGTRDPTVAVLTAAAPPLGPSFPRPRLTVAAAFIIALLLGGGIAAIRELGDPRIRREDDLLFAHRLPILARIPRLKTRTVRDYLTGKVSLPSSAWKGYRTLRAALGNVGPQGELPKSILVTSACPGDGKTMTAVNLAITLSQNYSLDVILVDADVHRPMVSTIFSVATPRSGFSAVLSKWATAESVLVPAPAHPRLKLLLAKREIAVQVGMHDGRRVKAMLEELGALADIVIIDSPPVPEVAEVIEVAAAVDAVVVAVRMGETRSDKLAQLHEMLSRRGISPVGFVVTTRDVPESDVAYDVEPTSNPVQGPTVTTPTPAAAKTPARDPQAVTTTAPAPPAAARKNGLREPSTGRGPTTPPAGSGDGTSTPAPPRQRASAPDSPAPWRRDRRDDG